MVDPFGKDYRHGEFRISQPLRVFTIKTDLIDPVPGALPETQGSVDWPKHRMAVNDDLHCTVVEPGTEGCAYVRNIELKVRIRCRLERTLIYELGGQ